MKMKKEIITEDYEALLHYDIDILFCGKNERGETMIGSIMEDDLDTMEYIYSIVEPMMLEHFKEGKISYLNVLKAAHKIYLVTEVYTKKSCKQTIIETRIQDIPRENLPLENSFI